MERAKTNFDRFIEVINPHKLSFIFANVKYPNRCNYCSKVPLCSFNELPNHSVCQEYIKQWLIDTK